MRWFGLFLPRFKKMGRPIKLTDEIQEKIVTALRGGNYIEAAAAYAGISKNTLYDWLKRGARSKRNGKFKDFSDAVEEAQAEAEIKLVEIVHKAAEKNWSAAAWHLERKFPDKWGYKARQEITTPEDKPVVIKILGNVKADDL